jgi:serine/threonine protein kinase
MLQRWLDPSDQEHSLGRIGKYEVFGVVGQGGMGLVLKALDTELERMVALKTLAHHVTARTDARLRLAREARAAAALHHPNIVSIFGLETWRDVPLIVMPLVEGGTLQQHASKERLTTEQVMTTALQIAAALAALHAAGIVHRDLKPSNILLQDGLDHVLLSDFGLARFDGDMAITHSDALAGTPFFMSPEQALGKSIDMRSDLFSFGSVMYWLCTGQYPFRGNSNYETLSKLIHSEADSDELARKQVPIYLQRLIHRLLAKEPSERWSSAEQVVDLLQTSLAHYQSPAAALPCELAARPPATRSTSHWPRRAAVALLAVSVIVIGLQQFAKFDRPEDGLKVETEAKIPDEPQQTSIQSPRYGALDELDRRAMLTDLERGEKLHYWLRRLAYLPVDEIPPESIPAVQLLAYHTDLTTRELSQVILNKNPFQEVVVIQSSNLNAPTIPIENPFQEVLPNE